MSAGVPPGAARAGAVIGGGVGGPPAAGSSAPAAAGGEKLTRIGAYKFGRTLGVGSFCKVKLATHEPTGQKVAIKILNRRKLKKQDMQDKVRTEIHILRLFSHPHIIRIHEVIDTPTDIYMVMEGRRHARARATATRDATETTPRAGGRTDGRTRCGGRPRQTTAAR
jgi:Protein kinase domain